MAINKISSSFKQLWINVFRTIMSPIARLRKLLRKSNMRQLKIAVGLLIIFSCVATAISYYWYRYTFVDTHVRTKNIIRTTEEYIIGTPMRRIPLDEVYKDLPKNDDDEDDEEELNSAKLINTVGCKIPGVFVKYYSTIKNDTKTRVKCGKRGVFLRKVDGVTVTASLKTNVLNKYMKHNSSRFGCCYQFLLKAIRTPSPSLRKREIILTNCTNFKDNSKITLQTDFIFIKCIEYTDKNETFTMYQDMFAFAKKINVSVPKKSKCKRKYNVMMIGMDSMSLFRTMQLLPKTIDYLHGDFWMNYRGYHKIADNTFPNLMAAFTGKNSSSIEDKCFGKMDNCNHFMIWNTFKDAGYVTAYGEDYLQLPDTFTNEYEFQKPPTDHYMRPFFLKGEYGRKDSTFLCAGRVCSGQQVLDYALDFAFTYRKDSFFGIFWINSFSHDAKSRPHAADNIIENFFYQMTYTGVLSNTFVIFFSDHGIRFGEQRLKMEAYYDDRMPMFFMWLPLFFKERHSKVLRSVAANQYRLITPYDIYSTLLDIKQISTCTNITDPAPEGCPNCHSTLKLVSDKRTCQDVTIDDKWCSCHKMYPLPNEDTEGKKNVEVVVNYITSMVKTIKTRLCWGCMSLSLKTIIRIHFYYDKVSLFYVVAFTMAPGNTSYEATVKRKTDETEGKLVGPVSAITNYRGLGKCAINHRDRLFCVCQKIDNC